MVTPSAWSCGLPAHAWLEFVPLIVPLATTPGAPLCWCMPLCCIVVVAVAVLSLLLLSLLHYQSTFERCRLLVLAVPFVPMVDICAP